MVSEISFYLPPFLVSFSIGLLLLSIIVTCFSRINNNNRKEGRHIHKNSISRFGGVAIILAFLAATLFDTRLIASTQLNLVLLAALAILFFGIIDDIKEIFWKKQILFQVILVLSLALLGLRLEYITNPFGGVYLFDGMWGVVISIFITLCWIIFLMNAINWIDGVDGVSGIVTLIASATIFFLSLKPEVNQPPIGIITAALMGALVSFLIFNLHPAKIMAGTSGSMFMGFILAVLAIFAGAKIATTLMVLAVPIIDALWVLGERIYHGKSVFTADQRHLHHKLLKIGWSVRKIFIFYFFTTVTVAALALKMRSLGKITTMIIFSLMMFSFLAVLARYNSKKIKNETI